LDGTEHDYEKQAFEAENEKAQVIKFIENKCPD